MVMVVMAIVGVLGFLVSVLGVVGRARGKLFGKPVTRQQTGLLVGSGFGIFMGSMLGTTYTAISASLLAFVAVLGIFLGLYLLMRGSLGPLQNRWIGLVAILAAVALIYGADKIQGAVGQQAETETTAVSPVVTQGVFF